MGYKTTKGRRRQSSESQAGLQSPNDQAQTRESQSDGETLIAGFQARSHTGSARVQINEHSQRNITLYYYMFMTLQPLQEATTSKFKQKSGSINVREVMVIANNYSLSRQGLVSISNYANIISVWEELIY